MLPEVRMARITDAIGLHRAKKLSCGEAAEMLGLSERHFRRLRDAYEADGAEGIIDGRRARASGRGGPVDEIEWVVEQFRTRYFDFTAKHFHEAVVSQPMTSGHAETIRDLIGDAFLGFLVSDGYAAYRDHPRRQRCLAHLIRKGIALAEGFDYDAARFGEWLVREMRGLIHAVGEQAGARILNPILARLKRACGLNQDAEAAKARALAREVLADWDAVTAFVKNQNLPPTNNDAETALRHAVIARRISYGTRTDEGSRAYAAILSLVETCRRRKADPWAVMERAIADARTGTKSTTILA